MGISGEIILKYRIFLFVAIIGIAVFFSTYLPEMKMEEDETTWFSKNDSVLEAY
jgi:predicted RND superfamily exporter protein